MTVESVTYISDLDDTYPASGDAPSEGDNHIRNIKTALAGTFASFTGAAVTATEAELNYLDITTLGTSQASKAVTADGSGNITLAGNLTINESTASNIKGTVNLGAQVGTGGVTVYHNAVKRLITAASGIAQIASDASTDTESRYLSYTHQDATERAIVGHYNSDIFYVRNMVHGGNVSIQGENTSGTLTTLLTGNPDGACIAYYGGVARLSTYANGVVLLASNGNTDSEARYLLFGHQDGTERGYVGHYNNQHFFVANLIHGGYIYITGETTGGTSRSLIVGNPDDDVKLYDEGTEVARTLPAASGGFQINNTSTGAGWERALTASDITALATSAITSGTFADARIAESNVTQHEAALTLTKSQISDLLQEEFAYKSSSTARTSTTPSADPDLAIAVSGAGTYVVRGRFTVSSGTGADIRVTIGGGSSFSFNVQKYNYQAPTYTLNDGGFISTSYVVLSISATVNNIVNFDAVVITAGSGTVSLSWASDDGNSVSVNSGGWMSLKKVA